MPKPQKAKPRNSRPLGTTPQADTRLPRTIDRDDDTPVTIRSAPDPLNAIFLRLRASLQMEKFDHPNAFITAQWTSLVRNARYFQLENPYVKRYLRMLQVHVVGHRGIDLQCRFAGADGSLSAMIETEFKAWQRKGKCEMTGRHTFASLQKFVLTSVARDGEIFINIIRSDDKSFTLQTIDPMLCDVTYSKTLRNGNRIINGIEIDRNSCPVAYHFTTSDGRKRVSSDHIIHVFDPIFNDQMRGISWLTAVTDRLVDFQEYAKAELRAAIVASNKMGFFSKVDDSVAGFTGERPYKKANHVVDQAKGNHFQVLPKGYSLEQWEPDHPNGNYASFTKATLRAVSAGLDVSYNTLAADLEGVNFSSIRSGVLEERDNYRECQTFLIDHFIHPVYNAWLNHAILTKSLPIKMQDIARYQDPTFVGRTWDWVDPKKDFEAQSGAIKMAIKSRRQLAREQGREIEDVLLEIKEEQELMRKYGIKCDDFNGGDP